MKRYTILLIAIASLFAVGCEDLDQVRANPVSMEVNGTFFMNMPDTSYIIVPNRPDASIWQHQDRFTFSLHETLYSKNGKRRCTINLEFKGSGALTTGRRYPLALPENETSNQEQNTAYSPFSYNATIYELSEGWIEFSEYGVNESGDMAYVSGTFGITPKDRSIKVTNGSFGRLLECEFHKYE